MAEHIYDKTTPASTILSCPMISASTSVKIHYIGFSDPQGGKGAADRLEATCESHVRIFINERNDVTTAHQLKDNFLSHEGIDGVRVVSMETIEDLVENSRKESLTILNFTVIALKLGLRMALEWV